MTAALIYHDVVAPAWADAAGFPGPVAARYKLTPADFEAHLAAIAASGAGVGLLAPGAPAPDVALTFDDGGASALDVAVLLEARGWRGHFLVTTGRIGTPGFLDADGVRELAARGHVVGSHSVTHPTLMGRLAPAELAWEWRESRRQLAAVLGAPPATAAVPGGFLRPPVVEAASAAGYALLLTSEPTRRVARHGAMAVVGRSTIWAATPPSTAAAYARGELRARARLWCSWRAKTVAKRVAPATYGRLRAARAG